MKSKTKFSIKYDIIVKIFEYAKLGKVLRAAPMSAGEFNAVYFIETDMKKYVLKIAPKSDTAILSFEKNMLPQEVAFYALIKKHTSMRVPKIYFLDFSKKLIDADYFIMEFVEGKMLQKACLNRTDKARVNELLMQFLAQLHSIKGNGFGYVQTGLCDTWHNALKNMIENLILDAKVFDKKLSDVYRLLDYVDKYKSVLENVPPCLVNFDLWNVNILYINNTFENDFSLTLIDPERCFFGDPLGDFVARKALKPLDEKYDLFNAYYKNFSKNQCSISYGLTNDEKIRYYIMHGYLSLIMQTEKTYRYKKSQLKYHLTTLAARFFMRYALKGLQKV